MKTRCRLYLITPPRFAEGAFTKQIEAALAAGDVASVQLRMKDADDAAVLRAGAALKPIVQAAGAAFLVNDRPDLAARLDADGVHIGQDDAPYAAARKALGPDRIVGVTCHASRHLAMVAAEQGADYVAFGAFYPSSTKTPPAFAESELLEWWQSLMETPCVAIGGITLANAAPLVRAGADFLAVAGGIWDYPAGPAAAVAAFNALFDQIADESIS
jgi:thiamine-phosphate pyrophosphorylase